MYGDDTEVTAVQTEEVATWHKRIAASLLVRETWEKDYRVAECYQYWRGKQREKEHDEHGERRAQHNKVHPDVDEQLASLYFYAPYGRVTAAPERSDTPRETVNQKARLLQDTGVALVRDKKTGFKNNTQNPVKEGQWAIGCVEVGYDADFINNPMAKRPPLKEKKETKVLRELGGEPPEDDLLLEPGDGAAEPVKDEFGLTPGEGSDLASLTAELKRLRSQLKGETFYVKHIPAKQILISPSDKSILDDNDWVGYWEDYPLEDVKASPAYDNVDDLKPESDMCANPETGTVDRVRLYRIWDLRGRVKLVLAKGHDKVLMTVPFERCALKFYRQDIDPYHFFPIPPVYLKLPAQDEYNDSAEYLRKMRIGTVPRYTYDQEAITADEAGKFQSRDFNVMIPRAAGSRQPIEPVNQPSTAGTAIQTLGLSEKEFTQASSASGNPLDPPTQTATRVVVANAKKSAQESFQRTTVAVFLGEIIEELILLAVDHMSLERWIAMNVDLDSPMAFEEVQQVAQTYQQINAEKLRAAAMGINWSIEVDADSLSPVSQAEQGMKLMQMINFISTPQGSALLSRAPSLLKRMMILAGIKAGEDVDAIKEALMVITQMNEMAMVQGMRTPGVSPSAGEPAPPPTGMAAPPAAPDLPVPAGVRGA